jgi:hypothetical protein
MLYSELKNLTSEDCTYEEFEHINNIYMNCETMTKADCAEVWWLTYGNMYKKLNEVKMQAQKLIIAEKNKQVPSDTFIEITSAAEKLFGPFYLNNESLAVDEYGIKWVRVFKKYTGKYSENEMYDLCIRINGHDVKIKTVIY